MRPGRYLIPALWGILALGVLAPQASARVESEVSTFEKRRAEVDKAKKIAKPTKAEALPVALVLPFAPEGFDLTDAEEAAAADAARRQANAASGVPAGPAPPSDRELLESIMGKIRPGGTAVLLGQPILMIGKKFVKIGAHFTVTYKGADYDLELTQIEGSNFTLRYKSEEITRPIQPGKQP
jgi:hypothetical protein